MKKRHSLTLPALLIVSLLTGGGIWVYTSPQKLETLLQFVRQKVANKPAVQDIESKPTAGKQVSQLAQTINGNDLIRRSRQMMQEKISSFSADILQIIQTPEMNYSANGTYVQTSRLQSRLEIEMEIKGIQGHLLQVSNGQVVWTVREIKNLKQIRPVKHDEDFSGEELRIERVDLKHLADFAEAQNITTSDPRFAREFSRGIPGLLAALEAEMNFTLIKQVTLQGVAHYVIQGVWKIPVEQRQFSDKISEMAFAGEIPQRVRLYLRASDLMLARYLCMKKRPEEKGWYAPLAMELSNIIINEPITPSTFNFSPAGDQVPKDITHKYLDRLEKTFHVKVNTNQ